MAQLVFVHGVATRNSTAYQATVASRDQLFRTLLFGGTPLQIHSPLWGDHVPAIPGRVFETDDRGVPTFSLDIGGAFGAGGGGLRLGAENGPILDIARQDPVAILDAIGAEIAERAASENRALKDEELHAFRRAAELIAADQAASLFDGDPTPAELADRLLADGPASYGIGSAVGDALTALSDRVRNAASTLGYAAVRDSLGPAIGLFIGDVFGYLKQGATRDRIQATVGKALRDAHEASRSGQGPLVVVGHSMGGVILADMLGDPRAAGIDGIDIDALLTVGSQPGLFASLGVLASSVVPGTGRRRPDAVKYWLNVFDPIDPLAFRADAAYADVTDLSFNSLAGITESHTKYFQRPQFYARARTRLVKAGVL